MTKDEIRAAIAANRYASNGDAAVAGNWGIGRADVRWLLERDEADDPARAHELCTKIKQVITTQGGGGPGEPVTK